MKNTLRILLLALPLVGCNRNAPVAEPNGLTRNQFIDIYVQLRQAQQRTHTAQEFEQQKKQIFQKAGFSEDALQKYVKQNANDVAALADAWDTISNRLTFPADTVRNPR